MERVLFKKEDKVRLIAYSELLFSSLMWGLSTKLVKLYITTIPTFHLLLGRFAIGTLVVYLFSPKKAFKISKKEFIIGIILGFLIFGAYAFNILGLHYTSASKAGFLAALSVLFIPILESVFKKKLPTRWTIISVLISIIGLNLISGMNGGSLNIGDLLVIGCAISYTIYVIVLDKYGSNIDNWVLSIIQLSTMAIISFITASLFEGISFTLIQRGFLPIAIIGIFGTGMTMFLQTKAQKVASPEIVGIILLGEPLFTLVLAFFILKEVILLKGVIGSVLITIALVLAIVKKV